MEVDDELSDDVLVDVSFDGESVDLPESLDVPVESDVAALLSFDSLLDSCF